MFDLSLLVQISLVLCITQLSLFFCVGRVVAAVHTDLSGIDLDDLGHNLIQKITVMGNNKYGTRIVQKIGFQPGNTLHIQMVGRLIEKKNVRLGDQKLTKCDACLLSAGESFNLLVEIFFCETKTPENAHQLTLVSIAVLKLEFMGQSGIGVHQAFKLLAGGMLHLYFCCTHAVLHINDVLLG